MPDCVAHTDFDTDTEKLLRQLEAGHLETGHPRCFGSLARLLAYKNEAAETDCGRCRSYKACLSGLEQDLLAAKNWRCLGAAPHQVNRDQNCGYSECGLRVQCRKTHDELFKLGAKDLISRSREVALQRFLAKDLSVPSVSPPLDVVSMETRVPTGTADERDGTVVHESVAPSSGMIKEAGGCGKKCAKAPLFDFDKLLSHRESLGHKTDHELLSVVKSSSEGLDPGKPMVCTYDQARELFLAASFELNERGTFAPRFRVKKRISNPFPKEQEIYARDIQLVDIHWLSLHGNPLPTEEWADIFTPDGLNYQRAWDFACHKVGMQYKAEFLGLGNLEQHCMAMLRSEPVREFWKGLHSRSGKVKSRIKQSLNESRGRRVTPPEYLLDAFQALAATGGQKVAARRLMAWMGHPEPEKTTFNRMADWLRKLGLDFPPIKHLS